MINVARRFLNLLLTFGFYTKHYKFIYDGDVTSANKLWSSPHWSVRSGIKNKYNKIFSVLLLEAKVGQMQEMSMFVFYNTRHDVCNLSSIQKILADTIKGKYLPDDNTKFYKSTHTLYDPSLPKGTVEFHLVGR